MANKNRLIDAEQAKRATYEEVFWTESEQAVVRNFLAKLPKVDAVEVVHGRWELIEEGQNTSVYQCSKCKRMVNVVCDRNFRERQLAKNYPYCNCGAKMDGERRSK